MEKTVISLFGSGMSNFIRLSLSASLHLPAAALLSSSVSYLAALIIELISIYTYIHLPRTNLRSARIHDTQDQNPLHISFPIIDHFLAVATRMADLEGTLRSAIIVYVHIRHVVL